MARNKRAKAKQAKIKARVNANMVDSAAADAAAPPAAASTALTDKEEVMHTTEEALAIAKDISCTGVPRKQTAWGEVIIDNFSVSFHGKILVEDCSFQLSAGRRYGLVGPNGCGKTTLLRAIGAGEVPIPSHIDVYHLEREAEASDKTPLQCVLECAAEKQRIEAEIDELTASMGAGMTEEESDDINARISELMDRLELLDASKAEARAARILCGLGFSAADLQNKKAREFSGGWRMRIALARALFVQPTLLILDEPTNHLDMESVVWLEQYLQSWNPRGIILLVSHSQDFLNSVCTNIIHHHYKKLVYYGGNYDTYVKTRAELEDHQTKQYEWEQDQIKHMKEYIARFGHGSAKLARQAQSKQKTLDKMTRGGLTEEVKKEKTVSFVFPDPEPLPPPVLQFQDVSFGYKDCPLLYKKVDLAIDLDSRVAFVGRNGVGKTTLMKLMLGLLTPTDGLVSPHNKLRFAYFTQHFVDQLDYEMTPLAYMMKEYPDVKEPEYMRTWLGRFGISGPVQTQKMGLLSDGQKSRILLCWMAKRNPHILLLDEPTNHLDMETIDSLADAINAFDGGVVLVSHDTRLIDVVARDIYLCEDQTVKRYDGTIADYKATLKDDLLQRQLLV